MLLLVYAVIWGYRRLDGSSLSDRRPFVVALVGFFVMLIGSVGIEALRFWSIKASLPLSPGGLTGTLISQVTLATFGFTGATLVLLTLFAVGLSLFTGLSWFNVMERIGAGVEWVYAKAVELRERRATNVWGRSPPTSGTRSSRRSAARSTSTSRFASRLRSWRFRNPSV
ncbi:MAG: hypothetical protein HC807_07530 [Gammaproteobacteria bacterium]|nr:hypothetical protein [Gammaproteobacteria bacterium]